MKSSDGFDARRLRPREPKGWGLRLGVAIGLLLALGGLALAVAGGAALAGKGLALGLLQTGREAAILLLVLGVALVFTGLATWRRCRRRMRRPSELSLSPHLLRKRG